jgi:hypothetical protein
VVVTDSSGVVLSADPTLVAGETVNVVATGFTGAEAVIITLHSTPETLTTVDATAGSVTYQFVVPSDLAAGSHYLQLVGGTSAVSVTWPFTLGTATTSPTPAVLGETVTSTPTSLPFTGANLGKPMLFAVAALWSGLVLLLLSRRGSLYAQPAGVPAGFGRPYRAAVQLPEAARYSGRHGGRHRSSGAPRRRH